MKKLFLSLLAIITINATALANYNDLDHIFSGAEQPNIQTMESGWYTGRCFSDRNPSLEKGGLLYIAQTKSEAGDVSIKYTIPAASIDLPVDKYDDFANFPQVDYETYKELAFEQFLEPATFVNKSLNTPLIYDMANKVGQLFLRQIDNTYFLRVTELQIDPENPRAPYFYCKFFKKVREL